MMLGQLGAAVVPRMMTLTEVYLWVLFTNLFMHFATKSLFSRRSRLQRVLPPDYFAFFRAKSRSLIKHSTFTALEAALLIMQSAAAPGSVASSRLVYVPLAWTACSLVFFVVLVELALFAHNCRYCAAVHLVVVVVGATVPYAFASVAWGPDAA